MMEVNSELELFTNFNLGFLSTNLDVCYQTMEDGHKIKIKWQQYFRYILAGERGWLI